MDISTIFMRVSGDVKRLQDVLDGKPEVIEWNYLEDLALQKSKDSAEYKCLLQTKGQEEIDKRLKFL